MKGVDYKRLGEKLADILEERDRARKRRSEEESKLEENWLTVDVMLVCRPCSLYSQSPEIPTHASKLSWRLWHNHKKEQKREGKAKMEVERKMQGS